MNALLYWTCIVPHYALKNIPLEPGDRFTVDDRQDRGVCVVVALSALCAAVSQGQPSGA